MVRFKTSIARGVANEKVMEQNTIDASIAQSEFPKRQTMKTMQERSEDFADLLPTELTPSKHAFKTLVFSYLREQDLATRDNISSVLFEKMLQMIADGRISGAATKEIISIILNTEAI